MSGLGYSVEGVIGSVIRYQHTKLERIEHVSLDWVSFDIMPPPVDYFDCGCVAREIMSWVKSRWWDMGSWHVCGSKDGLMGDYDPCHLMCAFAAHVISGGHAFSAIQIEAVVRMYLQCPYPFKRASYLRDKEAGVGTEVVRM